MQRAVNPQTGEVLFLVNNQWTPPSQVATNPDTGQMAYLVNNQWQVEPKKKEEESGVLRQAADIPVQVSRGAVMGVRMLSDTLGANNPVSQALSGAEDYLGELLSAEAQKDQQKIAKILKDAEDKGVLDQVKAGIQALAVAPVDLVSQVVGTAVPTIASGLLGRILKLGAVGIGTLQAGTGAAMGAGLAKGNIYEVVKQELMEAEIPEEIAEERAKAAQNYTGENWDQIILGGVLGGAAALGPLERIFARLPAISPQVAAKNIFARSAAAGVAEAAPEAAQAFQEQVAQNIALQREGFDVPTFRGAVANTTLEGLAGFGIGAPIGALEGKPGAKQPPGQQAPEEPAAPPPAAPITDEDELTPEEEADLQARIAAAPPATGLPVAATPTQPLAPPDAVQQVTASPEAVALPGTQQVTPQAAPELEVLTAQLARIQQARMDPTLSPDDPAFLEFDQQEAAIQARIQQLTAPPAAVTQPPVQPLAPPVAPVVEPEVIPEEALVGAPVVTPPQISAQPPTQPLAPEITPPAAPVITPIIAQTPPSPPQAPKGAADNFLDAVVTQFGMDRGEAQKALDTLVQEELIELDPNSGQFRMKDGRFWDPDVMRKAAAMQTAAPPLQLPQPLAPPVAPVVEPEVIPEEAMVETPVVTPPATPIITAPPPSAPAVQATEPVGDLFETTGISEQPTRAPRKVAAEPSPIEKLAAEKAPTLEDETTERMRQLGVLDFDDASQKVQEAYGVSKPVADAYVRSVRKEAEEIAKSTFGMENEFQKAYDESTKLRNRMEGIRKRKAPKEEKKEERPVEVQTWDVFYTGTSNLAAENIEASSAQKAKEIAAEKEGLKSIARLTAKKKEKRIKTEAAPTEKGKFTLSQDGIVGSEIEPSRVPNGNDAFQYAVGRVEQDGAEGVFRRRADERGTYGGWRVETSVDKLVPKKPSIRKTREVAEGTVVERIELPDNIEIRIVKLKDGYSVYQYDLDADQVVMGLYRQFRSPAFKNDQDAYQAAEAFASDMFDKVVPKMADEMQAAMKERLSRGEDVVNNKTPDPGIPADQRLVLMACCATKKKGMGMGPAIDVYTGVFFQTLKNKLKEGAMPNLRILSAKYGFIAPDQKIEIYDQVMDKAAADGFMLDDKLVEGFPSNIKDVLIVGSDQYQRVMKAAIEDLIKAGKIDKGASINVTKGGIGEQRAQLGRYLASLPASKEKGASKTPSEFYQQMLPDAGFKRLAQGSDRTYKNKSGEEFLTFERDGIRVAVKSNTQLYADGRGVGMYMGEGNDLLIQAMIVDESARRQGKATKALQDILSMADQAGMTSYIEPVQMTKDVGMTTEQLKDFYKRFGFKRQKTEPVTDRVMIREPGAKIEVAKKEVEAPTITPGQQRNLNYWRENVAPAIRDYLTAYKNVGVERLERSRFKPEGISATEWLLKLRSQKSVFGKGGRKVSDTGIQMLSKKDLLPTVSGDGEVLRKAMLKAIQAINKAPGYTSDWIENMEAGSYDGIPDFEPRKEEKPKAEQFVRGTEEQLKPIQEFAKRYGGSEVAYYDPDKDIGMVLAFGKVDGDPKYIPYIKGIVGRTALDISVARFPDVLPYKAELLEIKERLEKAAEKKHQENPFIKFERGIALSDDMDPKIEGIIREWKDMLGLGGINIYFSTTEDAKKNINNFTGPHRRIGSATIDANERGSMRRMEGGASYYVVFDKSTSTTKMLEVIAHEMGHVHEKVAFDQAPQEVKDKLKAAYEKWLEGRKDKTSREAIQMLRAKTTAQTTDIGQTIETAEQLDKLDPYWLKFSEWYADQVSRWAVTNEKPVGVVEKFFARLGAALRRFYQTLKGQKYLPDETFVQYLKQVKPTIVETIPGPIKDQVNQDMSSKMLKDLFGSEKEAVDIKRIMEVYPPKKKLPPKRSPELAAAAAALNAGELTAAEYDALVNIYRPIPYYFEPLKPATEEQVIGALYVSKKPKANPTIQNGHRVGLRLDIPAFDRYGVFVVSIHQKRTPSSTGEVIGYASVAKAKNITFGIGNELKALDIAMGQGKDALQTMEGEYVNITPEQAFAEAQRTIKDPNYVQVGFDPTRHSYFFDRRTTLPVVSAEEVLQIGNMILAKKPVFGRKQDFLYNIDSAPVQSAAELDAKRDRENQEKLQDLKDLRPTKIALPEKVRSYASSEEGQRVIAALNMTGEELERTVQKQYEGYTADNFMRRARKGLDEGEISADVFAVVQSMYMADPKLLDGLRLDVKQKFTPEELAQRRAEGKPSPMGAFAPFERVVYLYTGTKGVTDPMTIRHELTHTLEQLMTPAQRKAVVNAYIAALKKAAKKHKDAKSREFFDNVVKYLNEPSNDTRDAMNKSLPSLDFYQFTSPSEYWAVNAEKLMAQRLGVPWDRFKKAVRKMFEKMKNIFGFDNRFVVHDVFDKIMSGSKERMDTEMLANFVASSKQEYEMIEKTKEDAELVRRYNRTPTSQTDSAPLRRIMIGAAENSKDLFKSMVESPSEAINFMFNSVNRGVMFLRNKFIWFGSGINEADRIRYNGAVKTAEGLATASVALDNMIRGGNIATQVIMQGGIEFNKNTQMYGAVQKDKSMANVYRAEAKLKEKLGDQLGTDIEQGYLQAKRSRSIIDEVETRTQIVESLNEQIDEMVAASKALDADPKATQKQKDDVNRELRRLFKEYRVAADELKTIKRIREDKVTMSEQEIADFIQREEAHPELKEILDNFNAVNQNLLRFWRDVGLLSEARYNRLSSIKDYVPWYRVMDDDADIHDPVQATTRSATNIGKEKLFKAGKPSVVTDFTVEENQKVFKVQPGAVNAVKLGGVRLKPEQYSVTPNGELTLKVEAKPGQLLVVETQREIENMIDNMTRNVMRMTMNGLRKYAANRIVSEYATREAGKIKRFATADRNKGRFDYIENGRRTIVEIQDPLIAEAVLGMETVGMKMWEPLAAAANFTRRTITLSPVFQLKQVFKDAPTAALVTGVRNPAALMGGVMRDFIGAVRGDDPVAEILRSQGIGGFYSPARTPEADVKRQIGIINNNTYDYVMKALDHFGDSSDMAQRIAIYKRVMAETGDETLALYQAANVINFLRHGSGQVAQALVKTVPFLNAYAQSIDVLYDALRGGGLRGKDRAAALQQLAWTGGLLAGTTLIYAFLVGDDDDYMKMDDQSKIRSYMIPGTDVVLPMNTSAAFFFKAIPELLYNKVANEGTETEVDAKRLRTAMKEAAVDLLLGPTPVPSAVKPIIEIGLDYNFFTSRPVTPRGMQSLDAYQQYDMRTSEAAKILSSLTGTDEKRVLNPMEADHLVRSIFGTAGAMVAWSSNLVGEAAEFRPEMGLKEMPVTGAFLRPEVPRGREDLFYKLKDDTDRKYRTFLKLTERDNQAEAQAYINRHPNLVAYYEYTSEMDAQLKEINSAIRFIGETRDPSYTPEIKRREIQEFLNLKQDILEGIEQFRKEAYSQ
jgi:GNAT superfamily N-acetyltransferase